MRERIEVCLRRKTIWLTLLTLGLIAPILKWVICVSLSEVAYVFLYLFDICPCLQQLLQACLEEILVLYFIIPYWLFRSLRFEGIQIQFFCLGKLKEMDLDLVPNPTRI